MAIREDRSGSRAAQRITREKLLLYQALFRRSVLREVRRLFHNAAKTEGLTQKQIANRLGVSRSLISKRLNGHTNMTLDTLSDLVHAMRARPELRCETYSHLELQVEQRREWTKWIDKFVSYNYAEIPSVRHAKESTFVWHRDHISSISEVSMSQAKELPEGTFNWPLQSPALYGYNHLIAGTEGQKNIIDYFLIVDDRDETELNLVIRPARTPNRWSRKTAYAS